MREHDPKDRSPVTGGRRTYTAPLLVVHGRMTELTETGNGNGKEGGRDSKRPITLSNP